MVDDRIHHFRVAVHFFFRRIAPFGKGLLATRSVTQNVAHDDFFALALRHRGRFVREVEVAHVAHEFGVPHHFRHELHVEGIDAVEAHAFDVERVRGFGLPVGVVLEEFGRHAVLGEDPFEVGKGRFAVTKPV